MRFFFCLIFLLSSPVFAEYFKGPISKEQFVRSRYLEIGLSAGTPAGLNFCMGYWFGFPTNYVLRFSGMHFGSTLNGIQIDFGRSFYSTKEFKALYAVSLRNSHMTSGITEVNFLGLGPYIGFSWYFFTVEGGLSIGQGENTKLFPFIKNLNAGSRLAVQLQFQIGIKALFWQ